MLKEKRPDVKMISKPDPMPEFTLKHLRHESEAWKRLLNFMLDENVLLKYRLAEALKTHSDSAFLEEAENFQSRFVKKDILIGMLRDDVAEIESTLIKKQFVNGELVTFINGRIKKLRNNIAQIEKQFIRLRQDFNAYMTEAI